MLISESQRMKLIEKAVELANNVIWEDRQITIRNVTSEEATSLPLRKDPAREGELRLIEIDGFDLTPCGGTHALPHWRSWPDRSSNLERAKGLTRIEFVAGTSCACGLSTCEQECRVKLRRSSAPEEMMLLRWPFPYDAGEQRTQQTCASIGRSYGRHRSTGTLSWRKNQR
jgi:alanyl-tRNA synthetase